MKTILVTKRTYDYHACIEGEPGKWGCGSTPAAAIGDLLMSWADALCLNVRVVQ